MGKVVQASSLPSLESAGLLKPLIYCAINSIMEETAISINLKLAQKLNCLRPSRRTIKLEECFVEVINLLPDNAIIKDFDVMFNPKYKVDVLKIMIDTCRKKQFSIIWPGKYVDGKLFYAENGFSDFKSFSVEEYDVTCII